MLVLTLKIKEIGSQGLRGCNLTVKCLFCKQIIAVRFCSTPVLINSLFFPLFSLLLASFQPLCCYFESNSKRNKVYLFFKVKIKKERSVQ